MIRVDSRGLALAAALLAAAAPHALAATVSVGGVAYSCTNHVQIGPDMSGLLKSFQIDKEYTDAFQDCVKACNATAGCMAVNVKEMGTVGPTMCQLFGKVNGVTPYPIQPTSTGDVSWGTACVNISRLKWVRPKPGDETYSAKPQFPALGDPNGAHSQDANRPGAAPGSPGAHRARP
jgi:hypothetical protein